MQQVLPFQAVRSKTDRMTEPLHVSQMARNDFADDIGNDPHIDNIDDARVDSERDSSVCEDSPALQVHSEPSSLPPTFKALTSPFAAAIATETLSNDALYVGGIAETFTNGIREPSSPEITSASGSWRPPTWPGLKAIRRLLALPSLSAGLDAHNGTL